MSLRTWIANFALIYAFVISWLVINCVVFWRTYCYYKYDLHFYYVHQMLGPSLCVSRGTANVLNLNLGMMLLPMCRSLRTWLRGHRLVVACASVRRLLDHAKGFHILCSYIVVISSVIHYFAHVYNAKRFSDNYNYIISDVNAAQTPLQNPLMVVLASFPGLTGIMMMMLLSVIISSSRPAVRQANFEIFWYTHRLYIILYLLILIHGLGGILKQQGNIVSHIPGCWFPYNATLNAPEAAFPEPAFPEPGPAYPEPAYPEQHYPDAAYPEPAYPEPAYPEPAFPEPAFPEPSGVATNGTWHRLRCREKPFFHSIQCSSWKWLVIPLCAYICDVTWRWIRRNNHIVSISGVIVHPPDVMELRLTPRKRFKFTPGQYILVRSPVIHPLESHPYTITMFPGQDDITFSIHIKVVGDWSELMRLYLVCERASDLEPLVADSSHLTELFCRRLYIEGPFCSPVEDILHYKISLCVAGGIGITPFISLFTYILSTGDVGKLQRLSLHWVCRSSRNFTVFTQTIESLHSYLWNINKPDLLEIQFYLTNERESFQSGEERDFLDSRLHKGRPDLNVLVEEISKRSHQNNVGVFTCGPKSLHEEMERTCVMHRDSNVSFRCYHDSF